MPVATILDSIESHAGAWTAILTFVLIAVTVFYAWRTHNMASEMKRARDAAIMPKLALDFYALGPTAMTLLIKNVGPGAALDIDVRSIWEPIEDADPPERRWRQNILAAGQQSDFFPPTELNDDLNIIPQTYKTIRLVGTMKDAAGTVHKVDESFDDLPEWRRILQETKRRFEHPTAERRLAEHIATKLDKPVKELKRSMDGIASAIREVSDQ